MHPTNRISASHRASFPVLSFNGQIQPDLSAWPIDKKQGTAVGEMITCTGDWTGSWTGYDKVSADRYITDNLQGGRLPEVTDASDPALLCSHWRGFYVLHNEDQRGFKTLQTVVGLLKAADPNGGRHRGEFHCPGECPDGSVPCVVSGRSGTCPWHCDDT